MNGKWKKYGNFEVKANCISYSNIVIEREVEYKNLHYKRVIGGISVRADRDKSLHINIFMAYDLDYDKLKNHYEDAGFGEVNFIDDISGINFIIKPKEKDRTHKIYNILSFIQSIEPIDFVYSDLRKILNLKPTANEMHESLIKLYGTEGVDAALNAAQEAFADEYDDVFLILAKHAQNKDELNNVVKILLKTQSIQTPEMNDFRFTFAELLYVTDIKYQETALALLWITDTEDAIKLRTSIYNDRSKIWGTSFSINRLDATIDTIMEQSDLTRKLVLENEKLKQELETLKASQVTTETPQIKRLRAELETVTASEVTAETHQVTKNNSLPPLLSNSIFPSYIKNAEANQNNESQSVLCLAKKGIKRDR